ncbi:MAG: type I 3-dehydroquinate dehydratase [Lentisphaerae bacterium]|nr:type I 3-dehydroquinate dehydratase [Lentisphaerota bacterium]
MMKKSFFNRQETAVTALLTASSIPEFAARIRAAAADGADGIALEINNLPPEERTTDNFRLLMGEVPLPFMFICYRNCQWFGNDDEARQEFLLRAAEAGAEVIDVMGDLYAPSDDELTMEPAAVARQKKLIAQIHERGSKVLISSHMPGLPPKSAGEIINYLEIQSDRGADICKIVTNCNTEEGFLEAIRADLILGRSFAKPFIHISGGKYNKLHRFLGTKLGLAITFGVADYAHGPYSQPLISSCKKVRDLIPWDISFTE